LVLGDESCPVVRHVRKGEGTCQRASRFRYAEILETSRFIAQVHWPHVTIAPVRKVVKGRRHPREVSWWLQIVFEICRMQTAEQNIRAILEMAAALKQLTSHVYFGADAP